MAWEENPRICLHMQLIAILSRTGVVNVALIHANRLAFGWTEGYLCIEAAPGQMVSQASWHERQEEASG